MMSNPADKQNPASKPERKNAGKDRIPMSVPQRHLEVTPIEGFHLHWFLSSRVMRAQAAGYEFVSPDEVDVNNFDLAGDASAHGSTDMGSRVSIPASVGGDSEERLYLMKLPQEFWEQDQEKLFEMNDRVAGALRGGQDPGLGQQNPFGNEQRYVPEGTRKTMADLFTPKRRR